jgi:hypothetical protein
MKQSKDPKKEPFEDSNFWQAFIYVRPRTTWASNVTDAIEKYGSYKFYPNQHPHPDPSQQPKLNEYWVILKNKNPVPYAQTHLNVHQLDIFIARPIYIRWFVASYQVSRF